MREWDKHREIDINKDRKRERKREIKGEEEKESNPRKIQPFE